MFDVFILLCFIILITAIMHKPLLLGEIVDSSKMFMTSIFSKQSPYYASSTYVGN
jgi:hypothetical protein